MTKEEYKKALNDIKEGYDAFYFENKYGANTHKAQFELLADLKGDKVPKALGWIKNCYDCYYKDEMDEKSPFAYLESIIEGLESKKKVGDLRCIDVRCENCPLRCCSCTGGPKNTVRENWIGSLKKFPQLESMKEYIEAELNKEVEEND